MRVEIKNLGPLVHAEFELGDWTIICGNNNTGKTYATYALFGFLSFWEERFFVPVDKQEIDQLFKDGVVHIDLQKYVQRVPEILVDGCNQYKKQLPVVFGSPSEKRFTETIFNVDIPQKNIKLMRNYETNIRGGSVERLSFLQSEDGLSLAITLLSEAEQNETKIPSNIVRRFIGRSIRDIIFKQSLPHVFIASVERTGVAIFRSGLNFTRNLLLEEISQPSKRISRSQFLHMAELNYPQPVKDNLEFIENLENTFRRKSFINKSYPQILDEFTDIIGGEYHINNGILNYIPAENKHIPLAMDESSSAVRSLVLLGFYLRHVAKPGDLLMIDEPELNLHPANQRRIARLLARLTHVGIKIFITTHSDYIIKELNTLIMLNQDKPHLKRVQEQEGYTADELIAYDKVKVYIAEKDPNGEKLILTPVEITPESGIDARSFDPTIDDMNRIQDEIIWGDD